MSTGVFLLLLLLALGGGAGLMLLAKRLLPKADSSFPKERTWRHVFGAALAILGLILFGGSLIVIVLGALSLLPG